MRKNTSTKTSKTSRETWTVQPAADVRLLMRRAIQKVLSNRNYQGRSVERRGLRTRLINEALRFRFATLRMKNDPVPALNGYGVRCKQATGCLRGGCGCRE